MGKKKGASERYLLLSLATSDINLARVFAEGARSAFSSGKVADGEFARLRTVKFYCDALRSLLQMTPVERESFSSDLQNLSTQIEWLSMQAGVSRSPIEIQEEASMKRLLKLLAEKG
ncbi:MAG TPA: hypothetical protein VK513_09110 [Terriglobales bacterium]|nr:hypothetical protein [Terriglobales bacterium]